MMDDEKDMMDDDEQDYSSFFHSDDGDEQQVQVQVAARPSASSAVLEPVEPVAALAVVGGRPPFSTGGYTVDHHGGVRNTTSDDQPSSNPPFGVNAAATMASSSSINATAMLQEAPLFPSTNNTQQQQQQQQQGNGTTNNNNNPTMMQSAETNSPLPLYEDTPSTLDNSLDDYLKTAFQSEAGAPSAAAAAPILKPPLAPMPNNEFLNEDSDATKVVKNDDNQDQDELQILPNDSDLQVIPAPPKERQEEIEIGSWSSDSEIEVIEPSPGSEIQVVEPSREIEVVEPSSWKGQPTAAVPSMATSFYSRPAMGSTITGGTMASGNVANNNYSYSPAAPPSTHLHQQQLSVQPYAAPSSSSHQYYPQQHHHQQQPFELSPYPPLSYVQIPPSHTPTWSDILPKDYYQQTRQAQASRYQNSYTSRKKLSLSLINMWEFTITIESLDYDYGYNSTSVYNGSTGGGGYGTGTMGGGGSGYESRHEAIVGLRAQIKKIAREHTGKDGRKGAIFERGGTGEGIVPEDPLLKSAMAEQPPNADGSGGGGTVVSQGRWRIPLGAYHPLMTYLTSDANNAVEGIPPEQLRAATLGRERMDKKTYATVSELLSRHVSPIVASALAPYQRGGVEFILDKEGRALLADEMGLGKTVQAIAAMSAFRGDWPLLVLCPSTARYHWELEFRQWMGSEAKLKIEQANSTKGGGGGIMMPKFGETSRAKKSNEDDFLKNNQINVLTSGKDTIIKKKTTCVVICSIGLIVNLATSGRIYPGMFKAVIVDESHALKSKSTKRTQAVLPILKAAERCLLLSGTPALARPSELWPQLSVLGNRRRQQKMSPGGIWCDEAEFMSKYVKPKGEENNKTKLAELHTMLTSTVMIRRMKADILKNLPSKIREKAYVNIKDVNLQNEFRTYMQLLRQGKGVLGKLARLHHDQHPPPPTTASAIEPRAGEDGLRKNKEVLHHLYNITGRSKIARVTKMLASWLSDPTKGKLCIFAHHLDVLDEISNGAALLNRKGSKTQFIRIDGSTSPKARQAQILQFQTDPKVRIAMLGITAAGVAVTLTASSTVWFAELFWTPAIMIQAEDRCHRIGQQGRVRCLYFIGRGTLDDVLWKLIEKKYRDLGAFVEGKENMDIALERELEDGEEDEILKTEGDDGGDGAGNGKKRKAQDVFDELFDAEDLELNKEINELCHEEEDMLNIKSNEEEEELESPDVVGDEKGSTPNNGKVVTGNNAAVMRDPNNANATAKQPAGSSSEMVIELLDDEDDNKPRPTIANIRALYRSTGILAKLKIDPHVQFNNLRVYTVQYPGPTYGLIMVACNGRVVVKAHHNSEQMNNSHGKDEHPKIGSIIVGVNGYLIPYTAAFVKVLQLMKHMMRTPPVTVMFAEDDDFTSMFVEDFLPNLPVRRVPTTMAASASSSLSSSVVAPASSSVSSSRPAVPPGQQNSEVIELLDDD
eukprot:CAMPEP_0201910104 /NCGR_PEP_ID=MMETSP0903-20130614/1601_1 /ASSEMBLY_ACC=CAM_ASM_000552 /TAXON_ID=420261 /ORGANISM="Thalassiosira antarctica, Strain CCMP982" /LENGTH=1445 /DNA_ID=CAMNT_0048444699 /DNA_START=84 /DNA_END=4421 /DNA_ORIENTATION=-